MKDYIILMAFGGIVILVRTIYLLIGKKIIYSEFIDFNLGGKKYQLIYPHIIIPLMYTYSIVLLICGVFIPTFELFSSAIVSLVGAMSFTKIKKDNP